MKRILGLLGAVLVLTITSESELSAQLWEAGRPGEELASVSLNVGAISPTSTYPDESTHATGASIGGSASWWALRHGGVRANVAYGHTEGREGGQFSAIAAHDPNVWLYSLEVAVRVPMVGNRLAWFPYLSGGPAGKSYRWATDKPFVGRSTFGWTYGGGVEIRPAGLAPFGVSLDARNYRSQYMWHGMQLERPTVNDLVFTVGISVTR